MKEILLISYFYPPCTLTAAQRPAGWVKYLYDFGFRPTVITRNWDVNITKPEDQLRDAGKDVIIDYTEKYEVHYLPYKASLRDRIFNSSNTIFKNGSKLLTLINSVGENYSNCFIPFSNFYEYACHLIEEKKFHILLISANPFIQFRFGYLLHKKYGITWVADYRDDWTTSEIIKPTFLIEKILYLFHTRSEKKWVGTTSFITSVSDVYTNRIASLVSKKGETIFNGFDELYPIKNTEISSEFVITYNGTLYQTQDVEGFIKAIKRCIDYFIDQIFIRIQFPGLAYDPSQARRIQNLIIGYENHFIITERIPKKDVIELQRSSDILLMLTHVGSKGIPSSKLYEYLAIQKPILCYPSDNDVVEQTLLEVGNSFVVSDSENLFIKFKEMIEKKINHQHFSNQINFEKLMYYSQFHQTKKLVELIQKS